MNNERQLTRREIVRGLGAATLLVACDGSAQAGLFAPISKDATSTAELSASDVAMTPEVSPMPDATVVDATVAPSPIPTITANTDYFVTTYSDNPTIDAATWSIAVLDRGTPLGKIDLPLLKSLKAKTKEHTLECISANPLRQAISNAIWTGVTLNDALAAIGVKVPTGVVEVKFTGADAYTTAVPVGDLDKPIWIVWLMNGEPLSIDHGYPARLLVPGRYGMKNPKWLTQMEFIDKAYIGFWEGQGWSDPAPYLAHAFIKMPMSTGATPIPTVPAGIVKVSGTAFAGSDPIASVEVSVDGGDWKPATFDYAPGPDIWTIWHLDVTLDKGSHTVQARCTTKGGLKSDASGKGSGNLLNGYDGSMVLQLVAG